VDADTTFEVMGDDLSVYSFISESGTANLTIQYYGL